MEQASHSPIYQVIKEFNQWCKDNAINPKTFLTIEDSERFNDDEDDKRPAHIANDGYSKLAELTSKAEASLAAAKGVMADLGSRLPVLDINEGFGDLYRKNNRTAVEQQLIEAVEAHLSPQERQQAIVNNTKVGEVVQQVNQSIQRTQELASQVFHTEKRQEKEAKQQQDKQQETPDKKMDSLGQEFGVLDEIVKRMRKVLDEKQPKQEQNKQKDKPKLFEQVPLGSDSISSKGIQTAVGHEIARGRGLEK